MEKSRPAATVLTSHTSIGNKALTWQISRPAAGVTSHPLTESSAIGAIDGTPTVAGQSHRASCTLVLTVTQRHKERAG